MLRSNARVSVSTVSSFCKLWWDGFSLGFTLMCALAGAAIPFRLLYHLEQQWGGVAQVLVGVNVALVILGGPLLFIAIFRALNFERPSNESPGN
ncbi:hypothetical protein [Singulisphaera acidiphila]|uniref:Uncharacterized protein n=1 Tax=Singulisphaera acidiphila (strain ATCC BAA-1392 / DSM 18658 / VKM B-2454 / MOB10) TaxID=886293 RepID=L0DQ68_SINAD|nr:hypothetical protein [Singulisphaera acidiphila]AGA31003.1 hypothetical protein Sinac_6947 [Singulisphaera acidiphila DSM 18658]